jgi:hypothetical protein
MATSQAVEETEIFTVAKKQEPPSHDEMELSDAEKVKGCAPAPKIPRDIGGWKWMVVVFAILLSTFLFALDNTGVADVQPRLILQFRSVSQIAWLSVAFIMSAVSTNLLSGKLYSQFNAKWLYTENVIIFEVGSALRGAAPDMASVIIGRAFAGLGLACISV